MPDESADAGCNRSGKGSRVVCSVVANGSLSVVRCAAKGSLLFPLTPPTSAGSVTAGRQYHQSSGEHTYGCWATVVQVNSWEGASVAAMAREEDTQMVIGEDVQ